MHQKNRRACPRMKACACVIKKDRWSRRSIIYPWKEPLNSITISMGIEVIPRLFSDKVQAVAWLQYYQQFLILFLRIFGKFQKNEKVLSKIRCRVKSFLFFSILLCVYSASHYPESLFLKERVPNMTAKLHLKINPSLIQQFYLVPAHPIPTQAKVSFQIIISDILGMRLKGQSIRIGKK